LTVATQVTATTNNSLLAVEDLVDPCVKQSIVELMKKKTALQVKNDCFGS